LAVRRIILAQDRDVNETQKLPMQLHLTYPIAGITRDGAFVSMQHEVI
jgi:hypothetical protein